MIIALQNQENSLWNQTRILTCAPLDPKHIVSFEEALLSQVAQQETITRVLIQKGIFSRDDFLKVLKIVNQEMKKDDK
jgi:hypothetical protein